MKKNIIAIGGGEIGRIKVYDDGRKEQKPIETMVIDEKIVELTGKKHPTLVFIGAASGDAPRYYEAVKNHFGERLGCNTVNLPLCDEQQRPSVEEIRERIMSADVIYVGGGSPTRLMEALKETGADKMLVEAYNQGVVMSGNSAGGCVWFESYDNEEEEDYDGTAETLKTKPALGIVHGYFIPHWNTKEDTQKENDAMSKDDILKMLVREGKWGYAVDEGAAIWVQTDGKKQTMTDIISKPGAKTYKLNQDAGRIYDMMKMRCEKAK